MSAGIRPHPRWWWLAIGFPLITLVLAVGGVLIAAQGGLAAFFVPRDAARADDLPPELVAQGAYLARLGNCTTCHTTRGGAVLAGGRPFATEWGTLYSPNLTPDPDTGLGDWSAAEFRHAMRHGASRHGLLYPAFPFQNFQYLDDADLDAIFAWLRQQPAVRAVTPANTLQSIAGWRPALLGWRMLFHRPQPLRAEPERDPAWQRGRYLVEGLGHCAMCHGQRGAYGSLAPATRFAGGTIPGQGWHAPALDARALSRWTRADLATYLRSGTAPQGSAYGPMAEVIASSLQYLTPADADAMAAYLLSLSPAPAAPRRISAVSARQYVGSTSQAAYEKHCADCHGTNGRGRDGVYPPLAGNPQVMAFEPVNLIRVTLFGAAAPTTAGNPAPHSMPPFAGRLPEEELIAILNHVRGSWGNDAPAVTASQVTTVRGLPLQ